jgi:peptide/nickel transport system ATP-binding protein
VPRLIEPGPGCRFAGRCRHAIAACSAQTPALREIAPGHRVACLRDEVVQ